MKREAIDHIRYHRETMNKFPYQSNAWYHHMKLAAQWTRAWRAENNLRGV